MRDPLLPDTESLELEPPQAPQERTVFDDLLDRQLKSQRAAVAEPLRQDVTPDTRAESLRLSKQFNTPVDVIERNLDDYRRRAKTELTDFDGMLDRAPKLAEWIAKNPDQAPLVQDHIPETVKLENKLTLGASILRGSFQVNAMFGRFLQQIGDTAESMGGFGPMSAAVRASGLPEWGREYAEWNDEQSAALGSFTSFKDVKNLPDFLQWVKETLGTQAPIMVPMAVGGWAGGLAAAGAGYSPVIGSYLGALVPTIVTDVGDTRGQLAQEDPKAKAPWSVWAGGLPVAALDAGLPGIGLGRAIERTFGMKAANEIVKRALLQPVKPSYLVKSAAGTVIGMATEGITEALQEAIQDYAVKVGVDKPIDWDETWEAMKEAGAAGALMGGMFGGTEGFTEAGHIRAKFDQAMQAKAFFNALADGSKEMPLATRSPEVYQKLLEHMTQGGPVENLYVPTDTFIEYWQGKDVSPELMAAELTGNPNALKEAEEAGTDLTIPTAAYAAKIAPTEHHVFFSDELRLTPDAMNAREAAAVQETLEKQAEEITKAVQEASKNPEGQPETPIRQAIVGQLLADSQFLEVAKTRGLDATAAANTYAAGVEAVFTNLGKRTGVDPVMLFNRYGLRIGPQGAQAAVAAVEAPDGGAPAGVATAGSQALGQGLVSPGLHPAWLSLPYLRTLSTLGAQNDIRRIKGRIETGQDEMGYPRRPEDEAMVAHLEQALAMKLGTAQAPATAREALMQRLLHPDQTWAQRTPAEAFYAPFQTEDLEDALQAFERNYPQMPSDYRLQDAAWELSTELERRTPVPEGTVLHQAAKRAPLPRLAVAPAIVENGRLRLSTRVPSAVGAPAAEGVLRTDLAVVQQAGKFITTVAEKMGGYPQLTYEEAAGTPDQVLEHLVQAAVDNLRWLYNIFPADLRDRAKLWYVGANRIAQDLADEYGVSDEQAAGVLAVLSPQMDWFKNVALAERVMKLYRRMEHENTVFSPELLDHYVSRVMAGVPAYSRTVWREKSGLTSEDQKLLEKAANATQRKRAIAAIAKAHGMTAKAVLERIEAADQKQADYIANKRVELEEDRVAFSGKTWKELPIDGQSRLLRAMDETEHSPNYHVILPEGDRGTFAVTDKGAPAKLGWGTYQFIESAIQIMRDGSAENIDRLVGNEHKVRSFFNNISNPWDPNSVTIDTHAVAAALLQPLSGESSQVKLTMGAVGHNLTGLSGVNAIYAEAYFRLAAELGILPREVQSITWEAIRGLFTPETKKKGAKLPDVVKNLWRQHRDGIISLEDVHAGLFEAAGGIDRPAWGDTPARVALDEGRLRAGDVQPLRPELSARRRDARGDTPGAPRRNTALADGLVVPGERVFAQGPVVEEVRAADAAWGNLLDRIRDGGFTYNVLEGEFAGAGKALSLFPEAGVAFTIGELTIDRVVQFAIDNAALLADPGNHYGAWFDKDNGMVYLDVSRVVETHEQAQELGRQSDQIAYFDLETFETHQVTYPEGWRHGPHWQGTGGPNAVEAGTGQPAADREALREPGRAEGDAGGAQAGGADAGGRTFYQAAQSLTVAEVFTSRLTAAVTASTLGKASGAQWKATIKNAKGGISADEFAFANLDELDNSQTYTKQQVLDWLAVNQPKVEVTILGEGVSPQDLARRTEEVYERLIQIEGEALVESDDERIPIAHYFDAVENAAGGWDVVRDELDTVETFPTYGEANARAIELADNEQQGRDGWIRTWAAQNVDYGRAETIAREELEDEREEGMVGVQYADYVEEPAVMVPGTYREVFLTGPENNKTGGFEWLTREENEFIHKYDFGTLVHLPDHTLEEKVAIIKEAAELARDSAASAQSPEVRKNAARLAGLYEKLLATMPPDTDGFMFGPRPWSDENWVDGHHAYGHIKNPIVRLRFDVRALDDSRLALFLEEVQPPQPNEFSLMPPLFQKNWRELAFKWALRYAADNGLAAVTWTNGQMQADRYSLSTQVDAIQWSPTGTFTKEYNNGERTWVRIQAPQGIINLGLGMDGRVMTVEQTFGRDGEHVAWVGHTLDEIVGKDLAQKMTSETSGRLTGLDLDIGGEGLKRLYDVDFPNVVNKLPAVKKNGVRASTFMVGTGRVLGERRADGTYRGQTVFDSVPGVEVTPAVKAAVLGGQTLFQGERGRIRIGADRQIRLELLKDADLSTFLHETGHLYLEVLGDIASELGARDQANMTPGQAAVAKDFQTILSWLGATDRASLTTEQHEQFARGFEAYLLEGKAPSPELRGAFARFRTWLVQIYKSAKALDVQLTDEVRGVFDRLLAGDEAIARAQKEAELTPLFATAEEAGMSETEFALYRRTAAQAAQQARDALALKLLREYRRERSKAYRERKAALQEEVQATLAQQPVYRALLALQRGEWPDGTSMGVELKLSKQDIVNGWGEAMLARLPKPWVYSVDGGIHPDVVAELFGFTSGDQLLQALVSSKRLDAAASEIVRAKLNEEFGDIRNDGDLREAAKRAVQENGFDQVLTAELRAIAKKAREVGPFVRQAVAETKTAEREKAAKVIDPLKAEKKAARESMWQGLRDIRRVIPIEQLRATAMARIAAMSLQSIRPSEYWLAANRAGQAALEAAITNDYAKAAVEKQKQRMAVELYRAANQALDEGEAIARYARRFEEKSVRAALGKAGHTYLDQVDAILERFELARVSNKNLAKRETLVKWLETQAAAGLPTDGIPAEIIEAAQQRNYRSMPLAELRDVRDTLKQIEHLARLKNRLLRAQKDKLFVQVRDELVTAAKEKVDPSKLPLEYRRKENRRRTIQDWFAGHAKIAMLARWLDGNVDNGPFWRAIIRPLNEAAEAEETRRRKESGAYQKIIDTHYPGQQLASWNRQVFIPAIGASLSKEATLCVALNWGNETSRERLLHDPRRKWNEAQIKSILDTLDKRDWQYVQATWDYLNTFWDEIAAKQKRVTGLAPEKVEPLPIVNPHGTFAGGYYPLAYDSRMSARAGQVVAGGEAKLAMQAAYVRTTTRRGHVETRLEHVELPVRLEIGVMFQHLDRVIHDLTHHEVLMDVTRLMRDKAVSSAILDGAGGDSVYRQFTTAFSAIANNGVQTGETTVLDKSAAFLKTGAQIAGLGANVWTAVQQPFGFFNGMSRVGAKWVMRGWLRWLTDAAHMENTAKWINETSAMMANRSTSATQDLRDLQHSLSEPGGWFDQMVRTASNGKLSTHAIMGSFLWHIALAQRVADIPTWLGAYEKGMAEHNGDEKLAVALADQAVLDSQGGGAIKDLSSVQRGGPIAKLFMTFYSYGATLYNETARAGLSTNWKSPLSIARFLGDLTLIYIMPSVGAVLMAHAMGKEPDDEDWGDWVLEVGQESAAAALNTMVFVRELGGLVRGNGARGWQGPTGARFMQLVYTLGNEVAQGEADENLFKALNATAGVLFRYPSTQVQKTIDGWVALREGRTENPLVLLVGPPPKNKK